MYGYLALYGYRVRAVETFTDPPATPRSLSGDELRLAVNQAESLDVIKSCAPGLSLLSPFR